MNSARNKNWRSFLDQTAIRKKIGPVMGDLINSAVKVAVPAAGPKRIAENIVARPAAVDRQGFQRTQVAVPWGHLAPVAEVPPGVFESEIEVPGPEKSFVTTDYELALKCGAALINGAPISVKAVDAADGKRRVFKGRIVRVMCSIKNGERWIVSLVSGEDEKF